MPKVWETTLLIMYHKCIRCLQMSAILSCPVLLCTHANWRHAELAGSLRSLSEHLKFVQFRERFLWSLSDKIRVLCKSSVCHAAFHGLGTVCWTHFQGKCTHLTLKEDEKFWKMHAMIQRVPWIFVKLSQPCRLSLYINGSCVICHLCGPPAANVLCYPKLSMPSQVQRAQVILKSSEPTHPARRSDARLKKSCLSIPRARVLRWCVKTSRCRNGVIYCVHSLSDSYVLCLSINQE